MTEQQYAYGVQVHHKTEPDKKYLIDVSVDPDLAERLRQVARNALIVVGKLSEFITTTEKMAVGVGVEVDRPKFLYRAWKDEEPKTDAQS